MQSWENILDRYNIISLRLRTHERALDLDIHQERPTRSLAGESMRMIRLNTKRITAYIVYIIVKTKAKNDRISNCMTCIHIVGHLWRSVCTRKTLHYELDQCCETFHVQQ